MTCKNKLFFKKRKAFTLIELLIVIAIIGILFIVLVSKVDFATDKAKATGVQTDFRSFQLAFDTVAKENAGFNTFGWDTGDANQDGIRNSYDEGDTNKDGVQNGTEVFTGHKVYAETFTKVYSLKKNGTGNYDRDALNRLETAINANLDPKLHITIKDDGEILMANGAQDPWNKEYHGWYITNAETDKQDRGAIVMYSDGANNEFGSEHKISNGVVSISIPGNNKYGKDDYAVCSVYTYINGYGEVQNITTGFSNNSSMNGNFVSNGNNGNNVTPDLGGDDGEGEGDDNINPGQSVITLSGGLYDVGAITLAQRGDIESAESMLLKSWDDLLLEGIIKVDDGAVSIGEVMPILPTKNAYGFYYGVLYHYEGTGYVFYSNGSVEEYSSYALIKTWPSGSAKYSSETIDAKSTLGSMFYVGSDGAEVYNRAYNYYLSSPAQLDICDLILPSDEGISSIANYGFEGQLNLSGLYIPEGITNIGNYAFWKCSGLTSITIGENVESIGNGAFNSCSKLVEVINNSPLNITTGSWDYGEIGANAYEVHNGASKVVKQNDYLFYTYGGVNYLMTYLGNQTVLTLPNNYNNQNYELYWTSFNNCNTLTSVTIGDGITNIENAFYGCQNLEKVTLMGNTLTSIGSQAFSDCNKLTNITIGNSITTIGSYAFEYCESLTSLTIPASVTSIDEYAFSGCNNLTEIVVPDSVTYIGSRAFYRCNNLTNITLPFIGESKNSNSPFSYIFASYASDIPESLKTVIITGVDRISKEAFYQCKTIEKIIIPTSVTSIGDYAFGYCESLTDFIMPSGVTSIGEQAFEHCKHLTTLELPDCVTSIGGRAFNGCYSLTSINIPYGITSIEEWTFYGCSSLTSIIIPDNVTSIGNAAFSHCENLTSIIIPNKVTFIGDNAFGICSNLESVEIPASVTSIGKNAFLACDKLTNITFKGTMSQLKTIVQSNSFNSVGATYVQCTDGRVNI